MLSWIFRNQKLILKNFIMCSILHNYCIIDNANIFIIIFKKFLHLWKHICSFQQNYSWFVIFLKFEEEIPINSRSIEHFRMHSFIKEPETRWGRFRSVQLGWTHDSNVNRLYGRGDWLLWTNFENAPMSEIKDINTSKWFYMHLSSQGSIFFPSQMLQAPATWMCFLLDYLNKMFVAR